MVEIGGFSKITKAYIFFLAKYYKFEEKTVNADPLSSSYKILLTSGGDVQRSFFLIFMMILVWLVGGEYRAEIHPG